MIDERLLIRKALRGNKVATRRLYELHEGHWFRLCLRYGKNRMEAQDIFQEGVARVFQNLKQFDIKRGEFKSWSNRVVVNAALRYLQKHQWRQSFEDLDTISEGMTELPDVLGRITVKELTQIIQQLPSGYRVVFNMYEIEGYSHKEIANTLNISINTSKSQLFKAKKLLRLQLESLYK